MMDLATEKTVLDLVLQVATVLASGVILYRAEPALNRMSGQTRIMVRLSMFLLVVGSVAQIGSIVLMGHVPTSPESILFVGVAALLSCERRMRVLIPAPRKEVRQ